MWIWQQQESIFTDIADMPAHITDMELILPCHMYAAEQNAAPLCCILIRTAIP
jgi:hypothetical protein